MTTFEQLRARFAVPPAERRLLLHATAEALALPALACRHRCCRRARRCEYALDDSGEPECLQALGPEQRAVFDSVFAIVERIAEGWHSMTPSEDPGRRADEETAIRIALATLRQLPESCARAFDWIRHYMNPPPPAPPVDTRALLDEMRAELAMAELSLGMAELRPRMRR